MNNNNSDTENKAGLCLSDYLHLNRNGIKIPTSMPMKTVPSYLSHEPVPVVQHGVYDLPQLPQCVDWLGICPVSWYSLRSPDTASDLEYWSNNMASHVPVQMLSLLLLFLRSGVNQRVILLPGQLFEEMSLDAAELEPEMFGNLVLMALRKAITLHQVPMEKSDWLRLSLLPVWRYEIKHDAVELKHGCVPVMEGNGTMSPLINCSPTDAKRVSLTIDPVYMAITVTGGINGESGRVGIPAKLVFDLPFVFNRYYWVSLWRNDSLKLVLLDFDGTLFKSYSRGKVDRQKLDRLWSDPKFALEPQLVKQLEYWATYMPQVSLAIVSHGESEFNEKPVGSSSSSWLAGKYLIREILDEILRRHGDTYSAPLRKLLQNIHIVSFNPDYHVSNQLKIYHDSTLACMNKLGKAPHLQQIKLDLHLESLQPHEILLIDDEESNVQRWLKQGLGCVLFWGADANIATSTFCHLRVNDQDKHESMDDFCVGEFIQG
jgi:hypothetical protein